jgi:hypothetical protein
MGTIYYNRSTDGGTTWGENTRITNHHAVFSNYPSVAASGSNVHVVWEDERDGNSETYYNHSTDGGTTWGTDTRLTDDPGNSEWATIAVSGSKVHVVWEDDRDGNLEIYYKRNPTGNVLQEREYSKFGIDRCVIYPNPFTTLTRIQLLGRRKNKKSNLTIYDASGRLVKSIKLTGSTYQLGTDLVPGVYFLKLRAGEYTETKKLIKIR